MTLMYVVLEANTATAPTVEQWQELFGYAVLEDFIQVLQWSAVGIDQEPFNSRKFSRGVGSDPDNGRHKYYLFGLNMDAGRSAVDVPSQNLEVLKGRFIQVFNYLRSRGVQPYAGLPLMDDAGFIPFLESHNITIKSLALMMALGYEERKKKDLNNALWTRPVATTVKERITATIEFSLRQALLESSLPDAQAPNLSVAALWWGDVEDANAACRQYLADDFALGAGVSIWYDDIPA